MRADSEMMRYHSHYPCESTGSMRIAYMLNSLGIGGAERLTLELAERMRERGHAVVLFTLLPRVAEEWPTSLPVFRLEMRRNAAGVPAAFLRGRRYLRELRPDVLHGHGFHANIVARLLKPFLPAMAVVSTFHNVYEGGRLRMLAYRATDPFCRRVTAVSQAVADRFVACGAVSRRKCSVIANAIDPTAWAPEFERRVKTRSELVAANDFIWLAIGRLSPAKDYPNLLRAFAQVCTESSCVQLWIAGEGTARESLSLAALALELGVADRMRWLGLRRDVAALLDAADGFVLSSAWEGMPLALAEAMAMEKLVVATDVGGVRELVGDAGALVPAGDRAALSQAMFAVMRQPANARTVLGRAARERIRGEFSLDQRAEQWEALYAEVLQTAVKEPQPCGQS